ncbi:retrovirus-related pol polyprotein from transposon TNT 1-94 [Tanacetum coccineum]|uniref:Retrovirus-related pol polyprotein from transposon TNT 1-94 n=1 Tax=Tanacetum coccineum TaxID=301880 RepID=A0ABQ4X9F0_9ASTR
MYKPTNNNLRTSSNSKNKTEDTTPRYHNDNQSGQFGNQRTMTVAGARETVGSPYATTRIHALTAKDLDTMHGMQEAKSVFKTTRINKEKMMIVQTKLEQVTWQRFRRSHLKNPVLLVSHWNKVVQKDDSNVIPDSSNICTNDNQVDQNAAECVDERAALANLIANLTLDTEENKTVLKQLKKANASLTQELEECKTNLDETSRALGEATSSRDSCLIALQTKQTELENHSNEFAFQKKKPSSFGNTNVLKPGMYRIASTTTQTRTPQLPHASRNTNPYMSKSSGVIHTTSVSRPQLKCYQVKDKDAQRHDGKSQAVLCNFVEKFLDVVYLRRRPQSRNLSSIGQFCDAEFWMLLSGNLHGFVRDLPGKRFTNWMKQPEILIDFLTMDSTQYFKLKEGIEHQTSTPRTPEQNGVVKRRNRTLVEAARTMLSASKLPLSFWAEAVATACYTQNRSIIISTHGKMAYHIINDRKPSIKHLHIFGCICYITRDGENLDKMKEKGDPCVMVGHSTQSKGLVVVYNKRTNSLIVESIQIKVLMTHQRNDIMYNSDLGSPRQKVVPSREERFVTHQVRSLHWPDSGMDRKQCRDELHQYRQTKNWELVEQTIMAKIICSVLAWKQFGFSWPTAATSSLFPNLSDGRENGILNGPLKKGKQAPRACIFKNAIIAGWPLILGKSTSGGYSYLVDKLNWMSKKQNCNCNVLQQRQRMALSASCAQVMWMRTQLQDYGFNYNKIPLYCDSQSAIAISCNPVQHSRTKHIHTRYHFIKEQVENGIIELYFVRTEYQLADMFTKALPEDRFKYLVRRIGMRCLTPAELEVLTNESA